MRLFVAIELPDSAKLAIAHLEQGIAGVRWLHGDQLHLTLAFAGDVEEPVAGQIAEQLARIRLPSFRLSLFGAGCFPDSVRARVLWAGVRKNRDLMELAGQVNSRLASCGVVVEQRPYSPHITLARLKRPEPEQVRAFLRTFRDFKLPLFPVTDFVLFKSRLLQSGAEHVALMSYGLHKPIC